MLTRRNFLYQALTPVPAARLAAAVQPAVVSFAVLSDVQYADRDAAGKRTYRESLAKLEAAVRQLEAHKPAFVIHLGDLVDGGAENAARILPVFRRLPRPQYHVLGNHDFFASRAAVMRSFGMKLPYYVFRAGGWRFVVLDGMQLSVKGGWPDGTRQFADGAKMLAFLKERGAPNAQDWNGAVGAQQRAWLRRTLEQARGRGERTVVFCHFPVLEAATTAAHLLWDHDEVLAILDREPTVAAYVCGHDHRGGYAERNGVHHITMRGVVENDLAECLRMVELRPDSIQLRRPGSKDAQVLPLANRSE